MQESEIYIHGSDRTKSVKIIDKSKRAFDIGPESTKSLELAIRKERNRCKHKLQMFKAKMIALWILMFKHHGIPPSQRGIPGYFLGLACFIAIDTVLLMSFTFHIFRPMANFEHYGFSFLLFYPAVTVLGPLAGIAGCITGSARLL